MTFEVMPEPDELTRRKLAYDLLINLIANVDTGKDIEWVRGYLEGAKKCLKKS